MKPKVRLLIAVVCWVWGFIMLMMGIGMGLMSQWAWGSVVFLALGGVIVIAGLDIFLKGRGKT